METWDSLVIAPAKAVLEQAGIFLGSLLLVIIILIIGWILARLIRYGAIKILNTLKVDDLSKRVELESLMTKGGISITLSELIGGICYWIILLMTFVVALNAAGLTIAADLLQQITLFIPKIISAIFVLIAGMFLSVIVRNLIKAAATNAGIDQANFLSKIAEVVIMIFAIVMALEQIGIGTSIIQMAISITLASLGLGFALAFGLGCKDLVGKATADFLEKFKK